MNIRFLPTVLTSLIALTAAACDTGAAASDEPRPIGGRAAAAGFVLEVRLPAQAFAVTDAIPVTTTLTWTGAPGDGRIWGSGGGPVTFAIEEIGGGRRMMGGAMTADCGIKDFPAGVPTAIPFRKSGAWSGDDPHAGFYQAWFEDPLLHLPAGQWKLTVSAGGFLAPCEQGARTFEAAVGPIEILVR